MEVSSLSMEVCTFSMEVVCFFSMEVWMVLKGGWLHAVCTFGHLVASRPGLLMFTFALVSSGCAAGSSIPSSWLFGPELSAKMIFIATFVTLFAPHWAFSRWMRCSTLTTYLTLTPGSGSRSLAFSFQGSDLVDCGWHCNSSVGLVSVEVLDGALCYFACCNSLSNVTVSFRSVCDLTHFLTLKCFVTWKSSSSQHLIFSSADG